MPVRALIHLTGEDPVLGELDEIPDPSHNYVRVRNPTKKDGKPLSLMDDRMTSVAYPWSRVTFVEFFNEEAARESVVGFFRETG